MKKLLLVLGVMLCSLTTTAQLVFVDASGKELANGATITMDKAEMNDWEEIEVALEGISIKNTTGSSKSFSMEAVVTELPANTNFACCFGQTCKSTSKPSTINLDKLSIAGNTTTAITQTEWVVYEEGSFGTCKVQFKLSTGNTLNVDFVYADPASVEAVTAAKKIVAIFDMAGNRISAFKKGINLVRFADGSVKKRIIK